MVHKPEVSKGKYRRPRETLEAVRKFIDQLAKAGFYSCRISFRPGNISVLATWHGARITFRGEVQADNSLTGRVISTGNRGLEIGDFEITSSGATVCSMLPEFPSIVFKWR